MIDRILGMLIGMLPFAPGALGAQVEERQDEAPAPAVRELEWKDGRVLRIPVPIAEPGHEVMTTIVFPEERIETAITGWPDGAITATARRGLLFLRLTKKGEGNLGVIGGSGTSYLLYIEGVPKGAPRPADQVVRIRKERSPCPTAPVLPPKIRPRPVGALELIQAMRTGEHPEGAVIARAKGEIAYRSERVELRLVYVYLQGAYVGRVYDLENLTPSRLPVDASRFKAKDETLVASGLRENVLGPRETTRLYAVFWRAEE